MIKRRLPLIISLLLLALAGCTKKNAAPEKADAGKKREENIVSLTKENLEHVEIKTETAKLGKLEMMLKAAGRVSENLNKTAKVTSTLEGRLLKLNYDLNDRVKAGEVIALVQTPELLGKALEIKAPIDGVITDRKSTVGESVTKETEIYVISEPAELWVFAEVKERDVGAVKVGQDAAFTVLAYPEEKFRGKVVRVGNRIEAESRTLEVRIEVKNEDGRLKPGMFADIEIVTTVEENVLLIAESAVQNEGEQKLAFVARGENRFEKRVIKTGVEQGGRVQVLDGIKEGEIVVTEGAFILKSELLKGELGDSD